MPLYYIQNNKALTIQPKDFKNERELQVLFEQNLEELLGVTFLETEYPTGEGFADALGLDENGLPVIIEYKYDSKDDILAQGLFYLGWLMKNREHFNLLVEKRLGERQVSWDNPRVILIAKSFDKFTIAAVQLLRNIELKKYLFYESNILYLEDVYTPITLRAKKPIMRPRVGYRRRRVA